MEPIYDSLIRQGIREKNHKEIDPEISRILIESSEKKRKIQDLSDSGLKKSVFIGIFIAVTCIMILLFMSIIIALVFGLLAAVIAKAGHKIYVKIRNKGNIRRRQAIERRAHEDIKRLQEKADQKTLADIAEYDKKVEFYIGKMLQNAGNLEPMVDHNVAMFERMLSHSENGSNKKFVEADFVYIVVPQAIRYIYKSQYTNPEDDFVFDKERFRDLSKPSECEGLAEVLARLTTTRIKAKYPSNARISCRHRDAEYTLHFKIPNRNYVAPRDIYNEFDEHQTDEE